MTLIVDLNPVTQKIYKLDKFKLDSKNMAKYTVYGPGGNGIDIVRLMGVFGEITTMTGFLGGINGEFFHNRLQASKIIHKFFPIKDETIMNISIFNGNETTSVFEKGPRITREELGGFYELYLELIEDIYTIVLTGDLPLGLSQDVIFDLINIAKRNNKRVILDISNKDFFFGIEGRPDMIFIDKELLEEFTNLILESDTEILKVGRSIQEKYTGSLIINLGDRGYIFIDDDLSYIVESQKNYNMNKLDSRAIVAGIVTGLNRQYDIEMILSLGLAFNMAYGLDRTLVGLDMSLIKKFMKEVEIIYINN